MTAPLVYPDDLGTYLNDPNINTDRATAMIADAQTLCETILSPLPPAASVVVKRVAARAYVSTTTSRAAQIAGGGGAFAGGALPVTGGVILTRIDKADLRRIAGGGGAFTIDLLAADFTPDLPPWDQGDLDSEGWDTGDGWLV